uniref:Uncharacterized protein n=1 Tax=Rhizophora mucronata TaxID=61149 RepID=A0A2P2P0L3_RHIMU
MPFFLCLPCISNSLYSLMVSWLQSSMRFSKVTMYMTKWLNHLRL